MNKARLCVLAACLLACVLPAGCGAGPKKVYDRAAFEKEFMRASPAEVRAKLGRPDEVIETAQTGRCWLYRRRTKDTDGVVDDRVSVCFDNDRVYLVSPVKRP